jgi:hypothetical protein
MPSELTRRVREAARILLKGTAVQQDQRQSIPPISTEEIAQIKQFFPLPKFFIFGHARSGTTLLARLIRVHPQVHCNWQGHFFTRPPLLQSLVMPADIASWLSRRSNRWNQGTDLSPMVLRGVCDLILEREAHQLGKHIVGDKSPNSLLDGEAVRLLHKVYPDGLLIFIVRDGRDAALSHRFQSFIDATQHLTPQDLNLRQAFIRHPEPFLWGEKSIFTPKGIQRSAQGWVSNIQQTHQVAQELFGDQYIYLKYEDLIHETWDQINRLWTFLNADTSLPELQTALEEELTQNPDADWQQEKASDIAQALKKGKSGSWRDMFTESDHRVFQEIAGDTLSAWGYPGE